MVRPASNCDPELYTSRILPLFVDALRRQPDPCLLDLGLTCGGNIHFFARQVAKVYLCDLLTALDRLLRQGPPLARLWEHFDYPAASFDGILFWDLLDHLDNDGSDGLIEISQTLLRPKGVVMFVARDEHSSKRVPQAFAIAEEFQLHLRAQSHLSLPVHHRHNRDILTLMGAFTLVKSFIYRNGLREYLFQLI